MSETYMERKVQQQAQTINELIDVLNKAATVFATYENHHAEKGASDKAVANGLYKQMCHDAISKARGNV
jgi:hypothetical protein